MRYCVGLSCSKARRGWQSADAAEAYRLSRSPRCDRRFAREEAILGSWLDGLAKNSLVLDIPCGTGRCLPSIVGRGLRYLGADISPAMIAEAQREAQSHAHPELIQGFHVTDAERMEFPDDSVDCVVVWRLLHHVRSPQIRQNILREAMRVTRSKVLISFHHTISFTNFRKAIRRFFAGERASPAITHWRLTREAADCRLSVAETKGFRKYVSINWFACLSKLRPIHERERVSLSQSMQAPVLHGQVTAPRRQGSDNGLASAPERECSKHGG